MRHEERAQEVFNSLQYMGPLRSTEYLEEQFREVAESEAKELRQELVDFRNAYNDLQKRHIEELEKLNPTYFTWQMDIETRLRALEKKHS